MSDKKSTEDKVIEEKTQEVTERRVLPLVPSYVRKQRELHGLSSDLDAGPDQGEVTAAGRDAPKGIEKIEKNSGSSRTAEQKKRKNGRLDPAFFDVKKVAFTVDPLDPYLRLCP